MSDMCMAGDVLVVPPRVYQLRHLVVIPPALLACSPATGLTWHCESDKLLAYRFHSAKLARPIMR